MKAVALETGLSIATVSRALRGSEKVRGRTSRRILEAAGRLGFERNPHLGEMMSAIRRKSTGAFQGNLALIWPESRRYWTRDRPLKEMRAAVFRRAKELRYTLDELYFSSQSPETLQKILINRGIHGLILCCPSTIVSGFRVPMDFSGFSCASLGTGLSDPIIDRVLFDTYAAMRLAVSETSKFFGTGVAALWDFSSEAATGQTARAAFLAYHPAGPAVANELFQDPKRMNRAGFSNALKKHAIRCLILFPRLRPPVWIADSIPAGNMVWINYPPRKQCFGWVDLQNQFAGARVVDLVNSKIHTNQTGTSLAAQSVLIPPAWKPGKARL